MPQGRSPTCGCGRKGRLPQGLPPNRRNKIDNSTDDLADPNEPDRVESRLGTLIHAGQLRNEYCTDRNRLYRILNDSQKPHVEAST